MFPLACKGSRKTAILLLLGGMCGLSILLVWYCSSVKSITTEAASSLEGDAEMIDSGLWSFPRYHVRFPPISLNKVGTYTFTCRGLPPETFTLSLRIVGTGDYDLLSNSPTRVELQLSDENAQELCAVSDRLRDWKLAWIPSQNAGRFWQANCRDLKVSKGTTYTLTLSVTDVEADSTAILVQPTLEGGGNELP